MNTTIISRVENVSRIPVELDELQSAGKYGYS